MFDSEYFRTVLQTDVEAAGASAVVALHLVNGRSYRLRSVVAVQSGLVTLEVYQPWMRGVRWTGTSPGDNSSYYAWGDVVGEAWRDK